MEMANSISVGSFYCKRKASLELQDKLEQAESALKKKPPPAEFKSSILGPPRVWQVFHKQADALAYADQRRDGLMTFAYEEKVPGSGGSRKFMVTHPSHMWTIHSQTPANDRCTYEVIPQGSACKLYFDLEYNKAVNPSSDGKKMVEALLKASFWALEQLFQIHVDQSHVLILDASTDVKFSQHLIYQMPSGIAFKDNIQCGHFVRHLVTQLSKCSIPCLSEEEQKSLFVKTSADQDNTSFCDLAVYTKNRNFRLFLSSKYGKNVPLIVAPSNDHHPATDDDWSCSDSAIFASSLITYFRPCEPIQRLLVTLNQDDNETSSNPSSSSSKPPSMNGSNGGLSPWAEIDLFIQSLVSPKGGYIRQWIYYESNETIIYQIGGSRFCSSIGREHKSNGVKYVVNLPKATYYQSCFDPECAAKRPPPQPIPECHLPWFNLV